METSIEIFTNPDFGNIRVSEINGEPMFCASDLAMILNYQSAKDALRGVDTEDRQILPTPTNGGIQDLSYVSESGLYQLVLKSTKPEAKQFRKWVTSEVLPSIRKHGAYMTKQTIEKAITSPDFLIKLATQLKDEQMKRRLAESKLELEEAINEENLPKVMFANAVATSNKSILVGEMAKILRQNGYEIGERRLFEYLRNHGYLCNKGERYNQPTQKAMELELFEIKKTAITKPNGSVLTTTTTKVTTKGQMYFVRKFLSPIATEGIML